MLRLVSVMKAAGLNENLPVFEDLLKLAHDPAIRPIIEDLATHYPALTSKLL
jgi:hypothetical protein